MTDQETPPLDMPDPVELAGAMSNVAVQCQALFEKFMDEHGIPHGEDLDPDPIGLSPAFADLSMALLRDPTRVFEAQMAAWTAYADLWEHTAQRLMGNEVEPVVTPEKGDRRFKSELWNDNPFFDFIKQSYLLAANAVHSVVADLEGIDQKTLHKAEFFTQQYLDALSPSNFVVTNPDVLKATVETGGRNLLDGLQNFLADIDPKSGRLRTRMVDTSAFELGKNIAVTPGKVIYQGELMQLLQFNPTTETVYRTPLLIVPPWINKYYVLDLQERNSFIRWATAQGFTVFVVSWVNPDARLGNKDFEDYVMQGPLEALDAIEAATGEREVNAIGYCIGGTLMGATLAYMAAQGDDRIKSITFFTALLDFSEPGDLGVFIDEEQVKRLEALMDKQGYLDGTEMFTTFNMIRANDLIWSFVISNYLLGKDPMAFDLLFWNSDSTRMPARMHSTYLRKMYLENAFREPGGITVRGVPIDLRKIDIPACFVSAIEDHIAPWKSTFMGAQVLSGPVDFVLSKSGHVAGIINPPGPRQYGFFTGPDIKNVEADEWFSQSEPHTESWWGWWGEWLAARSGDQVPARQPGDHRLKPLEDAPGSFAKTRIVKD